MKSYLNIGLSCLFALGALLPASAKQDSTMTIASYNIRNLFDGIPNPGNKTNWKERAKPQSEILALSKVIHKLDADVIAFQEVESKEILDKFRKTHLKGMGYHPVVLIEGNDGRGIDVALMTRFQVKSVKTNKDLRFPVRNKRGPQKFSRDLLQVNLTAPGHYDFSVFVAHLKSKYGGKKSDIKRKAEAREVYKILNSFHTKNPKANFVLMGDFNDTPRSGPMTPFTKSTGLLKLKDIAAADLGIRPKVYTYHPKKYRSRIDYIMVSPGMMKEYKKKSVFIYKSKAAIKASDHLPLVAKFSTREGK